MPDTRVDKLEAALQRLAARMDQLAAYMSELAAQMARLTGVVGNMRGELLELRYREKAHSYFQGLLRGIQSVPRDRLEHLATDAEQRGTVSMAEHADLADSDVVVSGELRDRGVHGYLVAEVSTVIDSHDVERAHRRAQLLERIVSEPVVPVVAGEIIADKADLEAQRLGVRRILDGRALN